VTLALSDDEKLAAAAAYLAAMNAGDVDAVAALTEPDLVVWHNHDDAEVDAAHSERTVRWLRTKAPDLAWQDVAVLPTPDGYVRRTILTGSAPGGPLRMPTCMVVTLSDAGRIARIDEYLDTAALAPLTGG
jgi:ketosteroid isomerase-like protein